MIKNKVRTYLLRTIDPVHIGTGGYRMDYIDNTIVLDYDGVPKIPGSSLSGVARSYLASMQDSREEGNDCGGNNCNCSDGKCVVCRTFGMSSGNESRKGVVRFSDALLLFFPVTTMIGPVWLTTIKRLEDFTQFAKENTGAEEKILNCVKMKQIDIPGLIGDEEYFCLKGDVPFIIIDGYMYSTKKYTYPTEYPTETKVYIPEDFDRDLIIVDERVFIQTVRRNLMVRTSVSIDPDTRTAQDKALFTYEALPRNSYLYFQLVFDIPKILATDHKEADIEDSDKHDYVKIVEKAMEGFKVTGIGGMSTRGFGRVLPGYILCPNSEEKIG